MENIQENNETFKFGQKVATKLADITLSSSANAKAFPNN